MFGLIFLLMLSPVVSQQFLDSSLVEWKNRLGLQKWNIGVSVVRQSDMPNKDILAHVKFSPYNAKILILSEFDYPDPKPKDLVEDAELSIVHELVHLMLSEIPVSKDLEKSEEQVVARISKALVNLKRGR